MHPTSLRIAGIGAVVIVAFDVVASLASRQFGFAYQDAAIGSYVIQAVVGFVAGRAARNAMAGAVAGAATGFAEATIGWWLSALVGPIDTSDVVLTPVLVVATIGFVVVLAAAVGFVGGFAGSRSAPRAVPAP